MFTKRFEFVNKFNFPTAFVLSYVSSHLAHYKLPFVSKLEGHYNMFNLDFAFYSLCNRINVIPVWPSRFSWNVNIKLDM